MSIRKSFAWGALFGLFIAVSVLGVQQGNPSRLLVGLCGGILCVAAWSREAGR